MKKTFALMATLFALTACGGGGGSDSPVAVNQPTNGSGNTDKPNTPKTTNGFEKGGKAIQFTNGKQTKEMESFAGMSPEKWGTIKIDGKEFRLIQNTKIEAYYDPSIADLPIHGGTTGYARFGVLHDIKNKTDYVFYTGKEYITPINEMPTTKDIIHYVGYAFAYRPSDKKTFATYGNRDPYPVNFKVDFANKKLTGEITEMYDWTNGESKPYHETERIKNIGLSATIKGNTFSGTKNGVSTEGVFVGSKAAEMTGLFKDDNNKIQGAFGAKQQGK